MYLAAQETGIGQMTFEELLKSLKEGVASKAGESMTVTLTPEKAEEIAKKEPDVWEKLLSSLPNTIASMYQTYVTARLAGRTTSVPQTVYVPVSSFATGEPKKETPSWVMPTVIGVGAAAVIGTVLFVAMRKPRRGRR